MDNRASDSVRRIHAASEAGDETSFAIPAEQLERLIARASVLQHAAGESDQRRLSEEEVLSIGREVGLAPEYVRRALSEYRADSLAPPSPSDNPFLLRLGGPAFARARRVVPGRSDKLHTQVDRLLREQERLRPIRQRGYSSVWEPDKSLASKITRAFDFEGRGYELSQLQTLEIVAAPADEQSSLLTLTADLSPERNEKVHAWGIGAGVALLVVLITDLVSPWLAVPAILAGPAVAPIALRWWLENKRRRTGLLLEGLLDQIEMRARR